MPGYPLCNVFSGSAEHTTALHNDQSLRDARAWLQPAVIIIITFEVITIPQPRSLHSLSLSHTVTDPLEGPLLFNVSGYGVSTLKKEESDNEHMTNYFSPYGSALDRSRWSMRRQPSVCSHKFTIT